MERIKYVPLKDVTRIEVYENSGYLNIKQIVNKKKPTVAVTGLFYTSDWKPTCHLKIDGAVKASSTDVYRGCAWNEGRDITSCRVPSESRDYKNHYACCALISDNRPYPDELINYNRDVGGYRGRTGFGVSDGKLIVYASTDGRDGKTPEELRDYLYEKDNKIDWFIMGDGGGKVNYFADGEFIQGREKSQNLILIYTGKKEEKPDKPDKEESNYSDRLNIISAFCTSNKRYSSPTKRTKTGYMQHSTGTPGATAKDFIRIWNKPSCQAEADFVIDGTGIYQTMPIGIKTWHCGGSGNNNLVSCEICEPIQARFIDANWYILKRDGKNNTRYAVEMLQRELTEWGYDVNGIDGIFGTGLEVAVKSFQLAHGLTDDGIVGRDTLHALQARSGSFLLYNTKENQSYFENVYRKAVYTCAYILNKIQCKNVNKATVMSHAEGYKMKVASNHADVGHWWVYHNKSMDDFRKDVEEYMNTGRLPFEEPEPQNEFQIAWEDARKAGVLDGSNPEGNLTRNQFAVVLKRLGLI